MGFPILIRWHLYVESGPWGLIQYKMSPHQSQDRLIFIMGLSMLLSRCLYIEPGPSLLWFLLAGTLWSPTRERSLRTTGEFWLCLNETNGVYQILTVLKRSVVWAKRYVAFVYSNIDCQVPNMFYPEQNATSLWHGQVITPMSYVRCNHSSIPLRFSQWQQPWRIRVKEPQNSMLLVINEEGFARQVALNGNRSVNQL